MPRNMRWMTLMLALAFSFNLLAESAKVPAFKAVDEKGQAVTLEGLKAKVVLLDFWATWCAPCLKEIPALSEIQKRHAGPGFTVLGAAIDKGGWPAIKAAAAKRGIAYPVALADDATGQAFGLDKKGFPCAYLIKDGLVVKVLSGGRTVEQFEKELSKLGVQ